MIHKFQRRTLETGSLFLLPYDIKFYIEVFDLIQKNKERLQDDFHRLLRSTETLTTTKDYVQNKILKFFVQGIKVFRVGAQRAGLFWNLPAFLSRDMWRDKESLLFTHKISFKRFS